MGSKMVVKNSDVKRTNLTAATKFINALEYSIEENLVKREVNGVSMCYGNIKGLLSLLESEFPEIDRDAIMHIIKIHRPEFINLSY